MAQLNASASQIQLTTNMITSGDTSTTWSDTKYPSAKAVADKIATITPVTTYPIGSVIMTHKELTTSETSAAANPATLLGLPGNWILIDKTFKSASVTLGKDPSTPTSTAGSTTSIVSETITYNDHSLLLQMDIQVRSSSTITAGIGQDPVLLASLSISNYGNYGVTKLSPGIVHNIAFATPSDLKASSVICYSIDGEGKLLLNDILNDGTGSGNASRQLAGGTHIYINTVIPTSYTDMKDTYCDKFYWKRVS